MSETHQKLLRALVRQRLHTERRALEASPLLVRRQFEHAWAPVDLLLERLSAWPAGLLGFWLAAPAGHVVLTASPSVYEPGAMPWRGGQLPAVARIAVTDLLGDAQPALSVVAHLVDHLLGSRAAAGGPWLSSGVGATPALQAVAERLVPLARLGYGPVEPRAHFAWAFSGYWLDRRALNSADPHVERLLRTSICHEGFWQGATGCQGDG